MGAGGTAVRFRVGLDSAYRATSGFAGLNMEGCAPHVCGAGSNTQHHALSTHSRGPTSGGTRFAHQFSNHQLVRASMHDPISTSRVLLRSTRASMLTFLRTELRIATTMLDAAESAQDESARNRRLVIASQACSEVVRFLSTDIGMTTLEVAEREELTTGLRTVEERMNARMPDRRQS
jgi:hypothetical protein